MQYVDIFDVFAVFTFTQALHTKMAALTAEHPIGVVNGRVISLTLNDPQIKRKMEAARAKLRANPQALREEYIKAGVLTPGGKLTKRYGG